MAAIAAPSFPISNTNCKLYFAPSSIAPTLNFLPRPISPKPLNLKPRIFILSSLSLYRLHLPSASFHGFEDTEEDPEPETFQNPEPKVSRSNLSGRLFVGNLPYSLSSSHLAELFREAGDVVSVEVLCDDFTDRSRGFAFVTMGSVENAEQAIRMFDGTQVGGRTIKVNFPEVPRGMAGSNYSGYVDSPHKIYAGNLGWGLTSQGLKDAFAEQPGFLSAKVIYERNSGKSQGYGFVSFETADDVKAALNAMSDVEVQGRPLRLNLAADEKPMSSAITDENKESSVDRLEILFGVSTLGM